MKPPLRDHCHERVRPPVLTHHIFVAKGVVFQDRLYCMSQPADIEVLSLNLSFLKKTRGVGSKAQNFARCSLVSTWVSIYKVLSLMHHFCHFSGPKSSALHQRHYWSVSSALCVESWYCAPFSSTLCAWLDVLQLLPPSNPPYHWIPEVGIPDHGEDQLLVLHHRKHLPRTCYLYCKRWKLS